MSVISTSNGYRGSKEFPLKVDGTADPAFAVDDVGRVCAWNNAAAELFGLREAEALGIRCHDLLQCSDENGTVCSKQCVIEKAALATRPLKNFDLRLKTKGGKLWCNLSTFIVCDATSGGRYAIHIVRPQEVRKRLEQAFSEFVRTQTKIGVDEASATLLSLAPNINARLTAREAEVLQRLAKGQSTRAIAGQLNISSATVNNHVKHILTKLDAHTRLEAIRHAESVGVI